MDRGELTLRLMNLQRGGPILRWDSQEVRNLAALYNVTISLPNRDEGIAPRCYVGHSWFWVPKEWPLSHWLEAIARHEIPAP